MEKKFQHQSGKIRIYSIPFMSDPLSCDEKMLRSEKYLLETDLSIFTDTSVEALNKPVAKAKIDMRNLRMIIDFEKGDPLYMDASGVIKFKGRSYYTFPWLFVYFLSVVTYYVENKKGVDPVYIRL